jgi:hypothetical protein
VNVNLPPGYITEGVRPRAMSQPPPVREMLPEAPAKSLKKRRSVPAMPRCEEIDERPLTPPAEISAEDEGVFEAMTPVSGTGAHVPPDTSISDSEEEQICDEPSPARASTSETEVMSPFLTEIKKILEDSPDEDAEK